MSKEYGSKISRSAPLTPRKFKIGQAVVGVRQPQEQVGILVGAYATINNGYRNPAYVVKCDSDGKERSYQHLRAV
jgi:hypothetical protein